MNHRLLAFSLLLLCTACPKRVAEPVVRSGPPRPFRLLAETPERETMQIPQKRTDLEVDTRDYERTPHVVATGETPLMKLEGARARLFGDAAGTKGWEVDNFVLIEVLNDHDQVIERYAVGFVPDGVSVGNERIDNAGRMSFTFDPGEIDLSNKLPENEPFKVRATALDYGGVGRVTDLFLILDNGNTSGGDSDDLGEH